MVLKAKNNNIRGIEEVNKDEYVSELLKSYRLRVWCPTIGRFVKDNREKFHNDMGCKLTRNVLLNEYNHLFELKGTRIVTIY